MAVSLAVNQPVRVTLAANTYTRFDVALGRNVLITADADVYYHPNGEGLDGQAVDGTEQFKWIGESTSDLRLPGSGFGKQSLPQPAPANPDGVVSFAFAGLGAPVVIWLCVVPENLAGGL